VKRYRHVFFDLDHTLWDFRANSRAVLTALFHEERLEARGVPDPGAFIGAYEEVNQALWVRYEQGRLHRDVLRALRFRNTLLLFGAKDPGLAQRLGHAYLERCPRETRLMPGARRLLDDLGGVCRTHIITNGFDEVQRTKLEESGIRQLFGTVLTSEVAGARKPDPRIFARALRDARAEASECLMVGDDPRTDMAGARNAGWDHAHFAAETEPDPLATYRVRHLDELRAILL